ncbi:MAG: polysaccharide biosynthesis tyrosine autokinase [Desulfobacula sp.]|nr:polysaccharide biosynthesis tyrosine autokinase [Desulfobacula sp.]
MFRKNKKRDSEKDKENLLMNFPSSSRFAESYRTLRTNLFFSGMEKEIKSVVITSAVEKEGKTITAVNLAHTIAQTDRKTLVMDCDLRRPRVATLFSETRKTGVTGLVTEVFGTRLTNGSLDKFSISDLILLTRLQQRSCRLDIENNTTQVALYFEKGLMTDIYWKNRPESKKLVNTLIKNNLLTKEEAHLAIGHQKKSVQSQGTILYTMGFVSKKDISKALSVHTIEAVRAVSSMNDGEFNFSSFSHTENKSAGRKINFEKLYAGFTSFDDNYKYMKNAIDSAVIKTEIQNLYILPAGKIPPNPSELIGSKRMEFLVQYLKKNFDFIIIDTPPVMPATDAVLMAPRTDGTVMVMKCGHAERKIIKDVLNQYKTAGLPIIGAVLNHVDMKKEGYYRYYHKYYSSYYGK